MQKLINDQWVECTEQDLINGDIYRIPVGNGGWQQQQYTEIVSLPVVNVDNIEIPQAQLVGDIYWVEKSTPVTITADVSLPDGEMMTMVEKVIDATDTIDDFRTKAVISNGVMTMSFTFEESGNYVFRQDRLNEGLERINKGFKLSFNDIEFDVYV